ncbi:unnamed protein product [Dicrocoelium dendriticum]|nr:unnamed protein product [Dicrocoelium dendriticum]
MDMHSGQGIQYLEILTSSNSNATVTSVRPKTNPPLSYVRCDASNYLNITITGSELERHLEIGIFGIQLRTIPLPRYKTYDFICGNQHVLLPVMQRQSRAGACGPETNHPMKVLISKVEQVRPKREPIQQLFAGNAACIGVASSIKPQVSLVQSVHYQLIHFMHNQVNELTRYLEVPRISQRRAKTIEYCAVCMEEQTSVVSYITKESPQPTRSRIVFQRLINTENRAFNLQGPAIFFAESFQQITPKPSFTSTSAELFACRRAVKLRNATEIRCGGATAGLYHSVNIGSDWKHKQNQPHNLGKRLSSTIKVINRALKAFFIRDMLLKRPHGMKRMDTANTSMTTRDEQKLIVKEGTYKMNTTRTDEEEIENFQSTFNPTRAMRKTVYHKDAKAMVCINQFLLHDSQPVYRSVAIAALTDYTGQDAFRIKKMGGQRNPRLPLERITPASRTRGRIEIPAQREFAESTKRCTDQPVPRQQVDSHWSKHWRNMSIAQETVWEGNKCNHEESGFSEMIVVRSSPSIYLKVEVLQGLPDKHSSNLPRGKTEVGQCSTPGERTLHESWDASANAACLRAPLLIGLNYEMAKLNGENINSMESVDMESSTELSISITDTRTASTEEVFETTKSYGEYSVPITSSTYESKVRVSSGDKETSRLKKTERLFVMERQPQMSYQKQRRHQVESSVKASRTRAGGLKGVRKLSNVSLEARYNTIPKEVVGTELETGTRVKETENGSKQANQCSERGEGMSASPPLECGWKYSAIAYVEMGSSENSCTESHYVCDSAFNSVSRRTKVGRMPSSQNLRTHLQCHSIAVMQKNKGSN